MVTDNNPAGGDHPADGGGLAGGGSTAGADGPAGATAALAARLRHDMVGALELFTGYLGERLGLYRALAREGPATSAELAGFAGVDVVPLETDIWRFYRLTS